MYMIRHFNPKRNMLFCTNILYKKKKEKKTFKTRAKITCQYFPKLFKIYTLDI